MAEATYHVQVLLFALFNAVTAALATRVTVEAVMLKDIKKAKNHAALAVFAFLVFIFLCVTLIRLSLPD